MTDTSSRPQDDNIGQHDDVAVAEEARAQKCLRDAEELKQEGNEHFRAKRWNEALATYRSGLGHLPKRRPLESEKGKEREAIDMDDEQEDDDEGGNADADTEDKSDTDKGKGKETERDEPVQTPSLEAELECARARSVINANIAACYVKLEEWKEAVSACSEALKDDPHYVKALQRRAGANEKLGSWTSLTSAQEDYNTLLTVLPSDAPQRADVKRALASLKPRIEAAQKAETAEMLDKLKGMGNNILGRFGLSTDNFQFTPNGEGGYSMNFAR
ncbi:hypothetical protein FOMPIDRAFT_1046434 [Fomitopsis schrenkii]|uniref:Uncharacterized protein n=1 Tax=Fomitopsis schrenkii TaxID=2126942 RepID=S8EI94_FOMSC|nr:hypothetical protein FOMPIDRAFT_1046434 [Fomitopsis schrenkii]